MPKPTVKYLARTAARIADVCEADVLGKSRFAEHVIPRWAAIYVARENGAAYAHIGRQLNIDHSTVMHAFRETERRLSQGGMLAKLVCDLRKAGMPK